MNVCLCVYVFVSMSNGDCESAVCQNLPIRGKQTLKIELTVDVVVELYELCYKKNKYLHSLETNESLMTFDGLN